MVEAPADRETTIRQLLPLVRRIAKRLSRVVPSADIDDLVGDGCIGAIRAVDGYDANAGASLQHYASRVILGAMLNGVRRMDPVSERVRRLVRITERARFERAAESGVLPTPVEMERCVPGLARARADAHCGTPLSLDTGLPFEEHRPADMTADPQLVVEASLERARIRSAVDALPLRLRTLVDAHYYGERSLRSIGVAESVSPQRVSQLHLSAIERMRRTLVTSA